jgi:hypothetical protein
VLDDDEEDPVPDEEDPEEEDPDELAPSELDPGDVDGGVELEELSELGLPSVFDSEPLTSVVFPLFSD